MGLRIGFNPLTSTSHRNLSNVQERLHGSMRRLASGQRIATGGDDPAGLHISERMRAKLASMDSASRNTGDGISLLRTAESSLAEATTLLTRMRELAVQAANGTLSSTDKLSIQGEMDQLGAEIRRIAHTTDYNGIPLFGETRVVDVQVGTDAGETVAVQLYDLDPQLGVLVHLDVSSDEGIEAALDVIDGYVDISSQLRSTYGGLENRLQSSRRSTQAGQDSLAAAESRIRDVDVALETAEMTRNLVIQRMGIGLHRLGNVLPGNALRLFA